MTGAAEEHSEHGLSDPRRCGPNIDRFYVVDITSTLFVRMGGAARMGATRLTRYPAPRQLQAA
jgi:hypothetical protein